MSNNNIKLKITNKTDQDWTIALFNQDRDIDGMFTTIFPIAWKVVRLGPNTTQRITYPALLQLGVNEDHRAFAFDGRETVVDADPNERFNFAIGNHFPNLDLAAGQNNDGTISCVNSGERPVDISLYKNGKPLITKAQVAVGDQAGFRLTPKVWVMWANQLLEGVQIQSQVASTIAQEVELTNISEAHLTLSVVNKTTMEKAWTLETA